MARSIYAIIFFLLASPVLAEPYHDAIVECPNGFNAVIAEMLSNGFDKYVIRDEEDTPTGVGNGVNRFYPAVDTFDTPTLAYLRMHKSVYDELMLHEWTSLNVIKDGVMGVDLKKEIANDSAALDVYDNYIYNKLYLDENGIPTDTVTETKNPKAWITLPVWDDDLQDYVERPNSNFEKIKWIGRWN